MTLSPNLTPKGPSWRQIDGKPNRGTAPVLPTQGPICHPVPVVTFTCTLGQDLVIIGPCVCMCR